MSSTKYSITNTIKRPSPRSQQNFFITPIIPPVSSFTNPVQSCTLILDTLNDTFSTKRISLIEGIPVKIGRATNKLTSPAETNGYFDSKVLSRTHAEVWCENGKVYIKDLRSSNGSFVNSRRINSGDNEDEKVELKSFDIVEFGIDIFSEQDKKLAFRKVAASVSISRQYSKNSNTKLKTNNDECTDDITKYNFKLNSGFSIYDFLEKELLNCQEESQKLNEMSTALNDISNIFENSDKVLTKSDYSLSKRESYLEKGKYDKPLDILKENREKKFEQSKLKGSGITSTDNFFKDINHNKHDNKKTIKLQDDEIDRLNEEIKRSKEKIENQTNTIILKDCELKTLQTDNKRLVNEISKIRQDLEKSNTKCDDYRELIKKDQTKHKVDTEALMQSNEKIRSLQNELKDSQKSLQSQLEASRALNELLKKNYKSLLEENKKLRENIRKVELENEAQFNLVKKLSHEFVINSGLENDLSKSSLPQVTRNGHSKQISESIKDSEWTSDNYLDEGLPIININSDDDFNDSKLVDIEENNVNDSCLEVFDVINKVDDDDNYKSKITMDDIANSKIMTDALGKTVDNKGGTTKINKVDLNNVNKDGFKLIKPSIIQDFDALKDNVINGDLDKNKLVKKCSRTASKGRGIRNIRSGSMTESSENRQIVQKVKDEKILERGIQLIKGASMIRTAGSLMTLLFVHSIVIIFIQNTLFHVPINRAFDFALVNLLPRLNSSTCNFSLPEISIWNFSIFNFFNWNFSWFNISTLDSFINNLPISDIISWNTSKINVEVLKLGATTLEFSMGWTVYIIYGYFFLGSILTCFVWIFLKYIE